MQRRVLPLKKSANRGKRMIIFFFMPLIAFLPTILFVAIFGEIVVNKNTFEEYLFVLCFSYLIWGIRKIQTYRRKKGST
jgi:hypothetical protein